MCKSEESYFMNLPIATFAKPLAVCNMRFFFT